LRNEKGRMTMSRSLSNVETDDTMTERRQAYDEIVRLANAVKNGQLDERGDPSRYSGGDRELIVLVNSMLDALIAPLHLASNAIDKIAHGTIPTFVIDDYKGEYNRIKQNLNTLLATLYGMHRETQILIEEIKEGRLDTRGNDWDFEGNWQDLIGGVNGTLDAVIGPVREASSVLDQLAKYQLSARMRGKYHGDHAIIKKALNTTGDSLAGAIALVAQSATTVADAVQRIQKRIEAVAAGSSEQARAIEETSQNIEQISVSFQQAASNTEEARKNVRSSAESMAVAKDAMVRMREAMGEIRSSADSTAAIVQEINEITRQTDVLASSAAGKAAKVRSSAGGFGVVASEIRRLSSLCDDAVVSLKDLLKQNTATHTTDANSKLEQIIENLDGIAMLSNLLGVNAAIEAAHVEGAGQDFEALTEDIRQLAQRSADSAKKTETLISHSVDLARKGESLTLELDEHVEKTVQATSDVGRQTDEIAAATGDAAKRITEMSHGIQDINAVTLRNVTMTRESEEAIKDLEKETQKLAGLVKTFHL
jgi:methyl-accepting chemotaxis protein